MSITLWDIAQNSEEWENARKGVVTASAFSKIVTPSKGELSKTSTTYMYEILAEQFGANNEFFSNEWTQRGHDLEDKARAVFEFITDLKVDLIGMVKRDCGRIGCSPDGLIGLDCGLEIKCPKASTHIKYLLDGVLPTEYKTQVQGSLMITERKYWYFMSYHPMLKPFILKVERDEPFIENMRNHIGNFLNELAIKRAKYEELS